MADVQIRVRAKDEASGTLQGIASSFASFGQKLAGPLAIGTAAVAAFAAGVKTLVGAIDDLDEAAQAAGISAVALADLRTGAQLGGVGAQELDKALAKLNARLADAQLGGEESQRIFKLLGVNFRDTSVTAEDALKALANGFAGWENGARKAAFAQQVLGEKIGPKFVALLNQGADGLKQTSGVTEEMVENATRLQGELDRLTVSSEQFKNSLTGVIAPLGLVTLQFFNMAKASASLKSAMLEVEKLYDKRADGEFVDPERIAAAEARVRSLRTELERVESLQLFGNVKGGVSSTAGIQGKGQAPLLESGAGKTPKLDDSFLKAAEALDAELRKLNDVSAVEQVLIDIEQGRIKVVSEGERQYLLQLAAGLDARKERIAAAAEEGRTIAAAMENAVAAQARLDDLTGRTARNRQARDQAALDDAFFSGRITPAEYDVGLRNVFGLVEGTNEALKQQKSLVEEIGLTFTSAFENAIGSGNGLRGVLKGLWQDLLRLATRKLITEPLFNSLNGLLKGVDLAGIFGGARAGGGPVAGGTAYLVGERGPELFVPSVSGTVVPNGAGGGVVITQQIAIDSRSDIASVRAAMVVAKEEAKREIINSMQRRGAFA